MECDVSASVDPVDFFTLPHPALSICCASSDVLVVGDVDGSIHFCNLRSRRIEQELRAFATSVIWIRNVSDDLLIAQGKITLPKFIRKRGHSWQEEEGGNLFSFLPHEAFCRGDVLRSSPPLLALPSEKADIVVGRAIVGKTESNKFEAFSCLKNASSDSGLVMAVKFAGRSRLLAAYESGVLALWSLDSNSAIMAKMDLGQWNLTAPLALDWDETSFFGVVAGSEDVLILFHVTEKDELEVTFKRSIPTKGVADLCIRKTDRLVLASACWDRTVRLFSWKKKKLKPLGALKLHTDTVESVTGTSNGLFAAASKDCRVSLWEVYSMSSA